MCAISVIGILITMAGPVFMVRKHQKYIYDSDATGDSSIHIHFAGYRCCWCQRSTHVNCFVKTAENKVCDFGYYRNLIVPPNHVFMKRRRLQRITSIVTPDWPEWKPLIVVGMYML